MPPFHLRVLGPVTVSAAGEASTRTRVTQPRPLALLALLALARPRGLQPRDVLMSLLWPEHDAPRARRGLRNALHELRRALDPRAFISAGEGLVGLDPHWVHCDAHDLEAGSWQPAAGEDARTIEPLQGLYVSEAPACERWIEAERGRLAALLQRTSPRRTPPVTAAQDRDDRAPRGAQGEEVLAWHLRGHYCFLRSAHDGDPATLRHARTYFERAHALDPTYAPAAAGLANYWAVAARRGVATPFEDAWAHCLAWSRRTLALSDACGVPHVHFGVEALYLRDDFARAGEEFATAITKEPTYADAHRFLAVWLGLAGRVDDAVRAAERAVALEPAIAHLLSTLGAARLQAGDTAGAEAAFREVLDLDPRHAPARERLLRILEAEERWEEAVAERQRGQPAARAAAFADGWRARGAAGYLAARAAEWRDEVATIEERLARGGAPSANDRFAPPVLRLVAAHANLGDWSRVRAWRLQAVAERPILQRWFATMPELQGGAP